MRSPRTLAGSSPKSTKRSAAKPPDLTFYVDECLGKYLTVQLISAGYDVRSGHVHFRGIADVDWLPVVGQHGWIVLTKDKDIRRRPIEVEALLAGRVRAFVLTATDLKKEEQADIFLRGMRKIVKICARRGPFIFNITRTRQFSQIAVRTLRRRAARARHL